MIIPPQPRDANPMAEIKIDDIKLRYASIAEARRLPGLRIVLGAYADPGMWREACKGICHVKQLAYTPVVTASAGRADSEFGLDGADSELFEWTAQSSAPVMIWNDERPRSTWVEQLYLAERLAPTPSLIPERAEDRVAMFGLANELCGENGFGWMGRLLLVDMGMEPLVKEGAEYNFWRRFGQKYGLSDAALAAAPGRMADILTLLDQQLASEQARGHRFFFGNRLSALDIYWATFLGLIEPLPEELCPMASFFRPLYTNHHPVIRAALSARLIAHRDCIYREFLELPVVF